MSYSPEIVFGNIITFKPQPNLNLSLLTKFIGEQYMSNIQARGSKLDSYSVNDLNISYNWKPKSAISQISISLLINNILDKEYISNGYFYTYDDNWSSSNQITTIEGAGYYPQAGINFLSGITISF